MPNNGPELRDIHVPYVSMWWPLAPGWWLSLAVLVALAIVLVVYLRRRAAWRRYVDNSLADLHEAKAKHAADGDALAFAATASQLVRRVARTRDARSVSMSGDVWREALAAMAPKQDVSVLVGLDVAKYRRDADIDVAVAARDVEAWVRAAIRRPSPVPARRGRRPHVPA
jgi:hypothetical protein